MDEPVARITAAGTVVWYLTDYQNSVIAMVNSAGSSLGSITYDGFGNTLTNTIGVNGDRYGFTGRERDSATGQQYNWARYYDPALGKWTSMDPLGFEAGDANLYRYVANHPSYAVDPSGLLWLMPWRPSKPWRPEPGDFPRPKPGDPQQPPKPQPLPQPKPPEPEPDEPHIVPAPPRPGEGGDTSAPWPVLVTGFAAYLLWAAAVQEAAPTGVTQFTGLATAAIAVIIILAAPDDAHAGEGGGTSVRPPLSPSEERFLVEECP